MSKFYPSSINDTDFEANPTGIRENSKLADFILMTEEHVTEQQLVDLNDTIKNQELRWRHIAPEADSDSLIGIWRNARTATAKYEDLKEPLKLVIGTAEVYGDSEEQLEAQKILANSLRDPTKITTFGVSAGFYSQADDNDVIFRTQAREGSLTPKPRCDRCRLLRIYGSETMSVNEKEGNVITIPAKITIDKSALNSKPEENDNQQLTNNGVDKPPESVEPENMGAAKPDEEVVSPNGEVESPEGVPEEPQTGAEPPPEVPEEPLGEQQPPTQSEGQPSDATEAIASAAGAMTDAAQTMKVVATKIDELLGEISEDEEGNEIMQTEDIKKQYKAYEKNKKGETPTSPRTKTLQMEFAEAKERRLARQSQNVRTSSKISKTNLNVFELENKSLKNKIIENEAVHRELARLIKQRDGKIKELESDIQRIKIRPLQEKLAKYELGEHATKEDVDGRIAKYETFNHSIEYFEDQITLKAKEVKEVKEETFEDFRVALATSNKGEVIENEEVKEPLAALAEFRKGN